MSFVVFLAGGFCLWILVTTYVDTQKFEWGFAVLAMFFIAVACVSEYVDEWLSRTEDERQDT